MRYLPRAIEPGHFLLKLDAEHRTAALVSGWRRWRGLGFAGFSHSGDCTASRGRPYREFGVDRKALAENPFLDEWRAQDLNRDPVLPFLDAFLRGNRDDEVRSDDGSISQALDLMNDNFVISRTKSNGPSASLLVQNLGLPNDQLATKLFMAVLSRPPSAAELSAAVSQLSAGTRNVSAENLLWALYNKVDFIYNY